MWQRRICQLYVLITTVLCLQGKDIGPDEVIPDTRRPVTAGGCRCKACNSTDSAFQHGDRENAAFMKPATQSSVYIEGDQSSSDACGAVSGITGPEYRARQSASPSCVRTHPADLSPWFSVDLLYVYSFQELILFREQSSTGLELMASVNVLVDGQLCYRYPSDTSEMAIPLRSKVTCEQTMTGRYIHLHKRSPEVMGVYPKEGSQYISLCQLQLWVCKLGTYGATGQSCQECSQTCKYTCDNYYGCDHRTLHDVGINKAVEVSSLQWGDGSYINDMFQTPHDSSHCVKTRDTPWPSRHWVRIDLGTTYMVYNLEVQARVDCCSEHELRKFYVSVADEKRQTLNYPPGVDRQCLYYEEAVPIRFTANLTCAKPKTGRFVTLIKNGTIGLSLCEVRIFGHLYRTLKLEEVCAPGSPMAVCGSRQHCDTGRCRHKPPDYCRSDGHCIDGTVCDRGKCKGKLNYVCKLQDECQYGLICDNATEKCKIDRDSDRRCSPSDCESNTVCDRRSLCRVKVGGGCDKGQQCVVGATCESDVCQCDTSVSEKSGDQCNPKSGKAGSKCKENKDCPNMDCTSSVCTCGKGTSTTEDFGCKKNALETCSNDNDCNTGLRCDDGKCKLRVGASCYGSRNGSCTADATCQADACKVKPGKSCEAHGDMCTSGSLCRKSYADKKCYVYSGANCIGEGFDARFFCHDGNCNYNDETCRRRAGQNCSLEQGQPPPLCYSGSVCDVDKICKYVLKAKCAGGGACLPGTVCDIRPDPSSRKRAYKLCHKPLGSSCRDDQDCVNGTICDTMKRCSIPQDESCQDQADMCMSGAKCKDGKCQCDKTRTRFRRDKCEGELGIVTGDCRELSPTCRDTMADCVGGTCQCGASFVPVREDLTCRRKDRFACFQNDSIPCSRGAVCDRGICVLQTGQRCRGLRKGRCQTVSVCDVDDHCRVNINQSCADQPTNCRDGAVCDFMKMCKVKPGGQCRSYGDCVAGSTCDQRYTCQCTVGVSLLNKTTHICVPEAGRVGGECVISSDTDSLTCNATFTECNISTSQCQCQPGFIVDHVDFSCRKKPGGLCTDDAECAVGSICITGTCSVPLGEHCEQNGDCISDTVCDSNALCKIDMHGSCSGSRQDFCRIGTVCDWLHQCHRPVGDRCSLTLTAEGNVHSCVAGANCQDSVCTCDPEVSSDYGAVCKPHAGRFGSPCGTETDGECTMPGTVCVNNMCVCDSGHSPDREFGCDENDTDSDASIGGKVVIAGIVVGGVLVAAAVALLIYRKMSHRQHSQQKDTYTERSRDVGDVITTEAETEEVTEAETEEVTEAETTEEVTETSNVDLDVSESEVDN